MAQICSYFSRSPRFMAGRVRLSALPQEKITFFFFFPLKRNSNKTPPGGIPPPLPSQKASPRLVGVRARLHARNTAAVPPQGGEDLPGGGVSPGGSRFRQIAACFFRVLRGFGERGGSEGPARCPAVGSEPRRPLAVLGFGGSLQRARPRRDPQPCPCFWGCFTCSRCYRTCMACLHSCRQGR